MIKLAAYLRQIEEAKENEENNLTVTQEWMKEKFDEFNRTLFNNELPPCELIATDDKKIININTHGLFTFLGDWYYAKTRRHPSRGYRMYMRFWSDQGTLGSKIVEDISEVKPVIYMNTKIRHSELRMESTLIHEMIHLYTYKDCYVPVQAHGKEFKLMCKIIHRRGLAAYNKDFTLTTYVDTGTFTYDDDTKNKAKEKYTKRPVCVLMVEFDEQTLRKKVAKRWADDSLRMVVCYKQNLNQVVNEIKEFEGKNGLMTITCSEKAFLDERAEYLLGQVSISRKYSGYFTRFNDLRGLVEAFENDPDKTVLYNAEVKEASFRVMDVLRRISKLILAKLNKKEDEDSLMKVNKGANLSTIDVDDISEIAPEEI